MNMYQLAGGDGGMRQMDLFPKGKVAMKTSLVLYTLWSGNAQALQQALDPPATETSLPGEIPTP